MDSIHHQHSKEIYSGEYEILEVSDPPSSKSNTHTFHRSIRLTYWRSASRIKRNRRSVPRNGKRKTICTFNPPFRPFKPLVNGKGTTDTFSLRGFRH